MSPWLIHFFNLHHYTAAAAAADERITFVFSINASELLHTIEQHYGAGFDATRYLDRFFNFIIPLPSANINQYRALLGWSEEERGLYEISADTFIKHWGLTLRELERYYRAIKTAVDEPDRLRDAIDGISKGNVFACNLLVPLVIGLGMTDKKMQESFIHGQDAAPLLEHVHYNRDLQDICWYNLCEEVGSPFDTDTLSQNDLDKLLVDAYNLIFNAESYNFRGTKVGRCVFTDRTKEKVVRIAGLLSKNAAF